MDEKEAEARPLMGTIFLVILFFHLLIIISRTINAINVIFWKVEYLAFLNSPIE